MEKKNKKPVTTFKAIKRSENPITRIDQYTFYVKSSDPKKEPYFVYKEHIHHDRWLCDCLNFVMNLKDVNSPTHICKHINMVKDL